MNNSEYPVGRWLPGKPHYKFDPYPWGRVYRGHALKNVTCPTRMFNAYFNNRAFQVT